MPSKGTNYGRCLVTIASFGTKCWWWPRNDIKIIPAVISSMNTGWIIYWRDSSRNTHFLERVTQLASSSSITTSPKLLRCYFGYPRFKSRRAIRQAYTGRSVCRVLAKRRVRLPKLGSIRTSKTTLLANGKIKCYTVCLEPTGRYYLSLQVAIEAPEHLRKTGKAVGIDVGITNLAISSDGIKYGTFNSKWVKKQAIRWQSKYAKRKHQATVAVCQWNHNHKTFMPNGSIRRRLPSVSGTITTKPSRKN